MQTAVIPVCPGPADACRPAPAVPRGCVVCGAHHALPQDGCVGHWTSSASMGSAWFVLRWESRAIALPVAVFSGIVEIGIVDLLALLHSGNGQLAGLDQGGNCFLMLAVAMMQAAQAIAGRGAASGIIVDVVSVFVGFALAPSDELAELEAHAEIRMELLDEVGEGVLADGHFHHHRVAVCADQSNATLGLGCGLAGLRGFG